MGYKNEFKGKLLVALLAFIGISVMVIMYFMQLSAYEHAPVKTNFLEGEAFRRMGPNAQVIILEDINGDSALEAISVISKEIINTKIDSKWSFEELMILQIRKRKSFVIFTIDKNKIKNEFNTLTVLNQLSSYQGQITIDSITKEKQLIIVPHSTDNTPQYTYKVYWDKNNKVYTLDTIEAVL
jgi:hypothetical protein